uniref:Uncharacterized protein n=1 Tax=Arundo donax TaxID=35708 RepID=A0A0A9AJ94_ARUDO
MWEAFSGGATSMVSYGGRHTCRRRTHLPTNLHHSSLRRDLRSEDQSVIDRF